MRGRGASFGSCPHRSGLPVSHCLSQRSFLFSSSAQDPSNLHSSPVVVYPDPQQHHVAPPPPLLFVDTRPRHLDMFCVHECVTSPGRESRMPGIQEFCRFQTRRPDPECFCVHSLPSLFGHVTARLWRRCRWRYRGNLLQCRRCWHHFSWT